MKNLIYTVHFDIPTESLDKEDYEKNLLTKNQLELYKNKLIANKISYSKNCGCDFICFDYVEDLNNFKNQFDSDISLYVVINFYKLYLLDLLSQEYDNILYIDQDVYINTDKNIFSELSDTGLYVWHENVKIQFLEYLTLYGERDLFSRSYINKCISSYICSFVFDWPINFNKYNTGIILGNKKSINKLNFKNNLTYLLSNIKQIENNKDIPSNIINKFNLNNEAFFANLVSKENVKINQLNDKWHKIINNNSCFEEVKNKDNYFYHFINKKFNWIL